MRNEVNNMEKRFTCVAREWPQLESGPWDILRHKHEMKWTFEIWDKIGHVPKNGLAVCSHCFFYCSQMCALAWFREFVHFAIMIYFFLLTTAPYIPETVSPLVRLCCFLGPQIHKTHLLHGLNIVHQGLWKLTFPNWSWSFLALMCVWKLLEKIKKHQWRVKITWES